MPVGLPSAVADYAHQVTLGKDQLEALGIQRIFKIPCSKGQKHPRAVPRHSGVQPLQLVRGLETVRLAISQNAVLRGHMRENGRQAGLPLMIELPKPLFREPG